MRYVKKTGTPVEAEGKRLTKTFVEGCWNEAIRQYENLFYDRHRLADFGPVLLREQKDDKELLLLLYEKTFLREYC